MRKTIRIISLSLAAVMLCCLLCSCEYFDEIRAKRAEFTDGTHQSFVFMDIEYTRVDLPDKSLSFITNLAVSHSDHHVVDSGVPLLFTTFGCPMTYYSESEGSPPDIVILDRDKVVTSKEASNSSDKSENGEEEPELSDKLYYVRSDYAEEINSLVESRGFEHYYYKVIDDVVDWIGFYDTVVISDEETAAIKRIISEGYPMYNTRMVFGGQYWRTLDLFQCDSHGLLSDNSSRLVLVNDGKKFYIYCEKNSDTDNKIRTVYEVSAEDAEAIKSLYGRSRYTLLNDFYDAD